MQSSDNKKSHYTKTQLATTKKNKLSVYKTRQEVATMTAATWSHTKSNKVENAHRCRSLQSKQFHRKRLCDFTFKK